MTLTRKLIYCGLCVFAVSVPVSIAGANIGLAVVLAGFVLDAQARRALADSCRENPLLWPWLTYLGISVVSALAGMRPGASLNSLVRWDMTHALAYFLLVGAACAAPLSLPLGLYAFGASVAAAAGLVQVVRIYRETGRVSAELAAHGWVHHVTYGELMCFAMVFFLSLLLFAERRRERVLWALGLALVYAALILSQARGAWLAALAAAAVCWAVYPAGRRRLAAFAAANVLLFGGAFLAGSKITAAASISERAASIFSGSFSSNHVRVELWRVGFRIFRDHPVLGIGPANMPRAFPIYHPESLGGESGWGNLHDLYIHQLAERGALGLMSLLWLLAAMLEMAWDRFRAAKAPVQLWALAMLPAFFVMNLTETSFQHAIVAFTLGWMLAAGEPVRGSR